MLQGGGERGIRTLGTLARSTVFETAPFDHSGTSPNRSANLDSSAAKNKRRAAVRRRGERLSGIYAYECHLTPPDRQRLIACEQHASTIIMAERRAKSGANSRKPWPTSLLQRRRLRFARVRRRVLRKRSARLLNAWLRMRMIRSSAGVNARLAGGSPPSSAIPAAFGSTCEKRRIV